MKSRTVWCWVCVGLAALFGCADRPVDRTEWVVMDTVAAVQFRGGAPDRRKETCRAVRHAFQRVNAEFNRFDANSAIRRLGKCTAFGQPCAACGRRLCDQSERAFNPFWRSDGTPDYGAIAKGFAVDVAAAAVTNLTEDLLIDLGGNLRSVRGDWNVGIAGSDRVLTLTNGMACATSAEYFRGKHIYDGRTGRAVTNAVRSVTVVHPSSAMLADGLSTTLFVLGREAGEKFLRAHYPEARAIWIMKD